VWRRMFQLKGDEVTGVRMKLHNEELHNLYSLLMITGLKMYLSLEFYPGIGAQLHLSF
jgi:hypothetical protein